MNRIYIYIYIYVSDVYLYIYIERERLIVVFIYIYIYIHTYIGRRGRGATRRTPDGSSGSRRRREGLPAINNYYY